MHEMKEAAVLARVFCKPSSQHGNVRHGWAQHAPAHSQANRNTKNSNDERRQCLAVLASRFARVFSALIVARHQNALLLCTGSSI